MSDDVDYLVIGTGSAGCLLANRLSADASRRVVVLEAGGEARHPLIWMPLAAGFLYYLKSLNWGYETEPQLGLNGRRIGWPRGRVLGGSTAINGMMAVRGHAWDYDHWASMGLTGWGYQDVLPHFKSFERNFDHPDGDAWHGRNGELPCRQARGEHPMYRAFLAACQSIGYPLNGDFNGSDQEGVGLYDFCIDRGRRVTAASAFLDPVRRRPNLTVYTHAEVRRLLFEGTRCVGVEYRRGGEIHTLRARAEVLLSAGAINSAQLLQVSGVGPAALLREHGVPVVADSPQVGANLQEHLGIYVQYRARSRDTLYGLMRPDRAIATALRAWISRTGPGTSVPLEAGGFLRTRSDLSIPDVHVTFVPGLSLAMTQAGQYEHGFLVNVYQLRPQSRGWIRIRSADPLEKPSIDPCYLQSETDLQCLRDGVQLARRIVAQSAFDHVRGDERDPGSGHRDAAELDAWIRSTANTIFHPVGTCRMGVDTAAVVDAELRVRGVQGLRVIDASVMPTIIGGNTSIPTMMIAEKGAALIRRAGAA